MLTAHCRTLANCSIFEASVFLFGLVTKEVEESQMHFHTKIFPRNQNYICRQFICLKKGILVLVVITIFLCGHKSFLHKYLFFSDSSCAELTQTLDRVPISSQGSAKCQVNRPSTKLPILVPKIFLCPFFIQEHSVFF